MKKRNLLTLIISIVLLLAVISSAFYLPQYFLDKYLIDARFINLEITETDKYANAGTNFVFTPPAENYQIDNAALSAMASMQLTNYEKIRLISHAWEGSSESVGAQYSDEDAYSMVELAKKNMREYYRIGLYPSNFMSEDGDSWYNWKAKRYCSTDATFHRFSAYYWTIALSKYDQSEDHMIIMMEDGTILFAACEIMNPAKGVVRMERKYSSLPIVRGRSCRYTAITPETKEYSQIPYYEDIPISPIPDPTCAGKLSISLKNGTEDYYLAQYSNTFYSNFTYGFQIIPVK